MVFAAVVVVVVVVVVKVYLAEHQQQTREVEHQLNLKRTVLQIQTPEVKIITLKQQHYINDNNPLQLVQPLKELTVKASSYTRYILRFTNRFSRHLPLPRVLLAAESARDHHVRLGSEGSRRSSAIAPEVARRRTRAAAEVAVVTSCPVGW